MGRAAIRMGRADTRMRMTSIGMMRCRSKDRPLQG